MAAYPSRTFERSVLSIEASSSFFTLIPPSVTTHQRGLFIFQCKHCTLACSSYQLHDSLPLLLPLYFAASPMPSPTTQRGHMLWRANCLNYTACIFRPSQCYIVSDLWIGISTDSNLMLQRCSSWSSFKATSMSCHEQGVQPSRAPTTAPTASCFGLHKLSMFETIECFFFGFFFNRSWKVVEFEKKSVRKWSFVCLDSVAWVISGEFMSVPGHLHPLAMSMWLCLLIYPKYIRSPAHLCYSFLVNTKLGVH